MPSHETLEAFVAEVEAGRYVEAIEKFYAEDASMAENTDAPRVGRETLIAGEKAVLARSARIIARKVGPAVADGDRVAIRWRFEFTAEDGTVRALDEIAWQRWDGEKVVEEVFFYDPRQLR